MPFEPIESMDCQSYNRLSLLLYGRFRVGKTEAILRVCERGDVVFLLSIDKGIRSAFDRVATLKKRLFVSYADTLLDLRNDIASVEDRIAKAKASGADLRRVWLVVDNITHMQQNFQTESRSINVKNTTNPKVGTGIVRDAMVQLDYGVLNTWTNEIVMRLLRLPCNVVFVALERVDFDTKIAEPSLVGQSRDTIPGLCDVIARMVIGNDTSTRNLICGTQSSSETGARGAMGKLNEVELADLSHLRDKYLNMGAYAQKKE